MRGIFRKLSPLIHSRAPLFLPSLRKDGASNDPKLLTGSLRRDDRCANWEHPPQGCPEVID